MVELNQVEQQEMDQTHGYVPKSKEAKKELEKLKGGKADGSFHILPEMQKVGIKSEEFVDMLTDLVGNEWEERSVP